MFAQGRSKLKVVPKGRSKLKNLFLWSVPAGDRISQSPLKNDRESLLDESWLVI